MSLIKTQEDIRILRKAGAILAAALDLGEELAVSGAILLDIDKKLEKFIRDNGAIPSFLNFEGFPNSACLSPNDQVVHGIPDKRVIKEGDILGIDLGLWLEDRCVDAARTVAVGKISDDAQRLLT